MQTRSQTTSIMISSTSERVLSAELPVEIDFDEASRAWKQNKQRRGASYYYLCGHVLANGTDTCKNPAKKGIHSTFYCHKHSQE
jgi:hypothetical protein